MDAVQENIKKARQRIDESLYELKKAILFTSLPVLGVAIAFSKDKTEYLSVLYISGGCLIGAAISVIIAYWIAVLFQEAQLQYQWDGGKKLIGKKLIVKVLYWTNFLLPIFATILYISGIVLIATFFYLNMPVTVKK